MKLSQTFPYTIAEISQVPADKNVNIEEGTWTELTLTLSNIEASVRVTNISLDSDCIQDDIRNQSVDHMRIRCREVDASSLRYICNSFEILLRGDKVEVENMTIGLCIIYELESGQIGTTKHFELYRIKVVTPTGMLWDMTAV